MALSGAIKPDQSGLVSNGNEGVLHIPQTIWAGASPSDFLMLYPGHLWAGFYDAVNVFYNPAPADY